MSETTSIYGLRCPLERTIFYVGKANDPFRRYEEHLAEMRRWQRHRTASEGIGEQDNGAKLRWLDRLDQLGQKPELVVLETLGREPHDVLPSAAKWREAELRWIERLFFDDHPLTNYEVTKGGVSRPGRSLTVVDRSEIVRRYRLGESGLALAGAFGVSKPTIYAILRRAGLSLRSSSESRRALSGEQEAEICQRYLAGESGQALRKAFGVRSDAPIYDALERRGIQRRPDASQNRSLNPTQQSDICARYLAGEKAVELSETFDVELGTVYRVLKRGGIGTLYWKRLDEQQQAEICERYSAGEPIEDICRTVGVSSRAVYRSLRDKSVPLRRPNAAAASSKTKQTRTTKADSAQQDDACRRYTTGESTRTIGRDLGVSGETIRRWLQERGIPRRAVGGKGLA